MIALGLELLCDTITGRVVKMKHRQDLPVRRFSFSLLFHHGISEIEQLHVNVGAFDDNGRSRAYIEYQVLSWGTPLASDR